MASSRTGVRAFDYILVCPNAIVSIVRKSLGRIRRMKQNKPENIRSQTDIETSLCSDRFL